MHLIYFATSSSGLGALGVSWSAFIIQLITFILGYLVLRKYAFGPIIKMLSERRKIIEDGVKLGEEMRLKNKQLEEQVLEQLTKARQKADQIIQEAELSAKELAQKIEDQANQKGEFILKEALEKSKIETEMAKKKLEGEIIQLITEVSSALTMQELDLSKNQHLVSKVLSEQIK